MQCNRCDVANQCTSCGTNYALSVNTGACVTCSILLNCNRCDYSEICAECKYGYSKNPSSAAGCCLTSSGLTWSTTLTSCIACSVTNCLECGTSPTVCATCKSGYSVSAGACITCAANLNCICGPGAVCISCLAVGFTISSISGGCVACPTTLNCLRCDIANQCASGKCNTNYAMTPSGSTGCCLSGYTWSNTQLTCIMCPLAMNCFRC